MNKVEDLKRHMRSSQLACLSCDAADISTEHGAVFALEISEFYREMTFTLMV